MFKDTITTLDQLREVIPPPAEPALRKQLSALDEHCRNFIARSTFLLLATANARGDCDVSPKGDVAGFVQVLDDRTILIPDRPGNQRADSLSNIIENPHVGLLFIIPGVEWTLRVNGGAQLTRDPDLLARCEVNGKRPALGIGVNVEEAFLHCPKCFIRSKLWDGAGSASETEQLPWAKVLREQTRYEQIPEDVFATALEASNRKLY